MPSLQGRARPSTGSLAGTAVAIDLGAQEMKTEPVSQALHGLPHPHSQNLPLSQLIRPSIPHPIDPFIPHPRIDPVPLPMLFPHWGHPPFLALYLYFILDGSSAGAPNPSQSHLMTQPTAASRGFSHLLFTRPCSLWEKWFRTKQGDNPGQQPTPSHFRDTLSHLCRLRGVFELSPVSFCQQKCKVALWVVLMGHSLLLRPGGMTV